mgnify:CR=1 FL=1|tara:strand:- start:316 stop:612 length:297 start_codon:yes stop_codon:yes gene_type:complete
MPFSKNDPNINRKGRPPKGEAFGDILRRRLDGIDEESGLTVAEKLMEMLQDKALGGDIKALDMILDRTEGKPQQHITSENENRLTVEHDIIDAPADQV